MWLWGLGIGLPIVSSGGGQICYLVAGRPTSWNHRAAYGTLLCGNYVSFEMDPETEYKTSGLAFNFPETSPSSKLYNK